ncbi:MAG: UDP-N-acetylmuramate--L-alanine ligase [Candidatus Babeliales bacterium]
MYRKKAHVHFVGIGGIGMSGIAKILASQGYTISGCDLTCDKENIKDLQDLGCTIYKGNNGPGCQDQSIEILVYSSALKKDNAEIVAAQKRGIPTITRALMLAELMRTKYSIAIAGSHGKTTTTSLISHILLEAGIDPTVIIGGHLKTISTNAQFGNGDFLVAEADESDRSLIHLQATLAVVTNIDLEHLETYKDIDDIKDTFKQFLNNLPFYGKAFICIDDAQIRSLLPMPHLKTITYGIEHAADIMARDITLHADNSQFTVYEKSIIELGHITLNMPGKHNVLNALAAIAVTRDLDIPFERITQALSSFKGVERRFSYQGLFKGAELFDDYGHHPVEIQNTLLVARKRSKNNLTVVFQPHRFTRTHALWDQFVDMFLHSAIDTLIITDIYPASEHPIPEVTGLNLTKALLQRNPNFKVIYAPLEDDFASIKKALIPTIASDDLILLQGAGKINKLVHYLGQA